MIYEKLDLISLIKDKRVLFLENGNSYLTDDLNDVKKELISNKIEICILCHLKQIPLEVICEYIKEYDVIMFQTTWTSEISQDLLKAIDLFREPKIVVDVYLHKEKMFWNPSKIHTWINLMTSYDRYFEKESEWIFEILKPITDEG